MAWAPVAAAGISTIGSLIGGKNAAKQQTQASNAASGLYSAEEQAIQQLLNNYFQQAPGLEQSLLNFPDQARKQGEGIIQEFGNEMGAGDQSLINSFRSQLGGVANPGAVLLDMARGQSQNEAQTAQSMEANLTNSLSGLDLQALHEMASLISAPLASSLGGLNNIAGTYANSAAAGGNPWAPAISSIGDLLSKWPQKSSTPATSAGPAGTVQQIGTFGPGANTNPYSGSQSSYWAPPFGVNH